MRDQCILPVGGRRRELGQQNLNWDFYVIPASFKKRGSGRQSHYSWAGCGGSSVADRILESCANVGTVFRQR